MAAGVKKILLTWISWTHDGVWRNVYTDVYAQRLAAYLLTDLFTWIQH